MRIKTYFFCKSLILKHLHGDTRFNAKNSVLKQTKMVSIYHKNNIRDTKKRAAINNSTATAKIPAIFSDRTYISLSDHHKAGL